MPTLIEMVIKLIIPATSYLHQFLSICICDRLYTPSQHYRGKRESSASESTMMTAVGTGTSSFNNGGGHGVNAPVAGNGSTPLITTMTGRRISTTPLKPTSTFIEESDMV